jgi:hypothetical protein
MVLTPGGYRDSDKVHQVPAGQKLCFDRDHFVFRDLHSGVPTAAIVPGALAPAAALPDGWKAYASWTNTSGMPVKSMAAQFTVPDAPAEIRSQTIFLFPGIQNVGGNVGILQPVLQFGESAVGGGPMWVIASWYVPTTGEAFCSEAVIPVGPGDVLTGRMTLTAASGGTFSYVSAFDGHAGAECHVEGINELTWCNITLETYDVHNARQLPENGPVMFDNISIAAAPGMSPIAWSPTLNPDFGESIDLTGAAAGAIGIGF